MKKKKTSKFITHFLNVVTIALIVECFLCAMMATRKYANDSCLDVIEDTAVQMTTMFNHAMDERREKLTIFADILAANSENPDELLQTYMKNFCKTQYFSALCIHREDGTTAYYGDHPHNTVKLPEFKEEISRLPYISDVFSTGDRARDKMIYQAVPIVRAGRVVAVLYGYMTLDLFPDFIATSLYDGNCRFFIVDGNNGNYLMDESNDFLGNIFDESISKNPVKPGYDIEKMKHDVEHGKNGLFVFLSKDSGEWYYTYYMPIGINNWSMHLTIDESTAFAAYNSINQTVLILMFAVVVLMVIHVLAMMNDNARVVKKEKDRLHRTGFISSVQRSLLNAHNNSDFVSQALKTVADEMQAETVLLLTFTDKIITNTHYWPSKDKPQAMNLLGKNIRDDFPSLYDQLAANKIVRHNENSDPNGISSNTGRFFSAMDITRIIIVPIMDNAEGLRGAIAVVNAPLGKDSDALESVTYDFFMAITNLENHNIIKNMGAMDYLTGLYNRNSYESNISSYETVKATSLWCAYIDANGLHDLNNEKGHKAGDAMLCTVAETIRKIFSHKDSYRLGGDEFVIFKTDSTHEEFMNLKYRFLDDIAKKGYSVSIGFSGTEKNENGVFDVEKITSEAEHIMYRDKWKYYEENKIPRDRDRIRQTSDE